jgi:hypothetical protein
MTMQGETYSFIHWLLFSVLMLLDIVWLHPVAQLSESRGISAFDVGQ